MAAYSGAQGPSIPPMPYSSMTPYPPMTMNPYGMGNMTWMSQWPAGMPQQPITLQNQELLKQFGDQFTRWESDFQKWKEGNKQHSHTKEYKDYEQQWSTWKGQLEAKRKMLEEQLAKDEQEAAAEFSQENTASQSHADSQQMFDIQTHSTEHSASLVFGDQHNLGASVYNPFAHTSAQNFCPANGLPSSQLFPAGAPSNIQQYSAIGNQSAPPPLFPSVPAPYIPMGVQQTTPSLSSAGTDALMQQDTTEWSYSGSGMHEQQGGMVEYGRGSNFPYESSENSTTIGPPSMYSGPGTRQSPRFPTVGSNYPQEPWNFETSGSNQFQIQGQDQSHSAVPPHGPSRDIRPSFSAPATNLRQPRPPMGAETSFNGMRLPHGGTGDRLPGLRPPFNAGSFQGPRPQFPPSQDMHTTSRGAGVPFSGPNDRHKDIRASRFSEDNPELIRRPPQFSNLDFESREPPFQGDRPPNFSGIRPSPHPQDKDTWGRERSQGGFEGDYSEGRLDDKDFNRRECPQEFGRDASFLGFDREGPPPDFGRVPRGYSSGPPGLGRDGPQNFGQCGPHSDVDQDVPPDIQRNGPGFGRGGPSGFSRGGPGFNRGGPPGFGRGGPSGFGRGGPGFDRGGPPGFGRGGPPGFGRGGPPGFDRGGPPGFGRGGPSGFGRDDFMRRPPNEFPRPGFSNDFMSHGPPHPTEDFMRRGPPGLENSHGQSRGPGSFDAQSRNFPPHDLESDSFSHNRLGEDSLRFPKNDFRRDFHPDFRGQRPPRLNPLPFDQRGSNDMQPDQRNPPKSFPAPRPMDDWTSRRPFGPDDSSASFSANDPPRGSSEESPRDFPPQGDRWCGPNQPHDERPWLRGNQGFSGPRFPNDSLRQPLLNAPRPLMGPPGMRPQHGTLDSGPRGHFSGQRPFEPRGFSSGPRFPPPQPTPVLTEPISTEPNMERKTFVARSGWSMLMEIKPELEEEKLKEKQSTPGTDTKPDNSKGGHKQEELKTAENRFDQMKGSDAKEIDDFTEDDIRMSADDWATSNENNTLLQPPLASVPEKPAGAEELNVPEPLSNSKSEQGIPGLGDESMPRPSAVDDGSNMQSEQAGLSNPSETKIMSSPMQDTSSQVTSPRPLLLGTLSGATPSKLPLLETPSKSRLQLPDIPSSATKRPLLETPTSGAQLGPEENSSEIPSKVPRLMSLAQESKISLLNEDGSERQNRNEEERISPLNQGRQQSRFEGHGQYRGMAFRGRGGHFGRGEPEDSRRQRTSMEREHPFDGRGPRWERKQYDERDEQFVPHPREFRGMERGFNDDFNRHDHPRDFNGPPDPWRHRQHPVLSPNHFHSLHLDRGGMDLSFPGDAEEVVDYGHSVVDYGHAMTSVDASSRGLYERRGPPEPMLNRDCPGKDHLFDDRHWERDRSPFDQRDMPPYGERNWRGGQSRRRSVEPERRWGWNPERERKWDRDWEQEKDWDKGRPSTSLRTPSPTPPRPPPPPAIDLVAPKPEAILIDDLLVPPGRKNRPPYLVVILRGLPGSGKSYVTRLIKEKEVEQGGTAPRILCLDDYFMTEVEVTEVDDNGKKVKKKKMQYEYEAEMEEEYRASLKRSFRKQIDDKFFNIIIVDSVNNKVSHFDTMWSHAKQKGFEVYIAEMENDLTLCKKRNPHQRSPKDIEAMARSWEEAPSYYLRLDVRSLLQADAIQEVEMTEHNDDVDSKKPDKEEEDDGGKEDESADLGQFKSKWDNMEMTGKRLDILDGLSLHKLKSHEKPQSLEDWLQLPDDYEMRTSKPGKKRVRWADIEERREQKRMRDLGFVIGQTDWSRMTDPTLGSSALTKTKYI
ncbi:unnamed protein product [Darwinula stevensoni]|uniref:YLP motif-containing protein 1 n=1 Tax=Darwinula stevensoni TaxID=69355 RepID=A0A7R9ABX5_9CRUS|nr:unnamed protein product [Darwinula stevensoni]CAG0899679.1 unnamed protein product [Darwinula stevensoni]